MASPKISAKRIAIDKANASLVIAVGLASFLIVFSMVASKALLEQRSYQSRVITKKKATLKQLKSNVEQAKKLEVSYKEFAAAKENILGGNSTGSGDRDGDNPRIILDSLPSKYDFPALATSLEKLLKTNNFSISEITGSDDEVAQAAALASDTPQAIEIPFTIGIETPTSSGKSLMQVFEHSVRPIQIKKLSISGKQDKLTVSVNATTYFQPGKNLKVKSEVVK